MQRLRINGIERQFPEGELPATITELLDHLNVGAATVVAEVDGRIIERESFGQTKLRAGQRIELIRLMGGG